MSYKIVFEREEIDNEARGDDNYLNDDYIYEMYVKAKLAEAEEEAKDPKNLITLDELFNEWEIWMR